MSKIKAIWGRLSLKGKIISSVILSGLLMFLVVVLLYVNSSFYFSMKFEKILEEQLFHDNNELSANWTFGEDETSFHFYFYECNSDEDVLKHIDLWNQFTEEHPYYARRTSVVVMRFYEGEFHDDSKQIAEVRLYDGEPITNVNMHWIDADRRIDIS